MYECRNWETEHDNSVLERTVSFLEWEPDIYIRFSPAIHLQCAVGHPSICYTILEAQSLALRYRRYREDGLPESSAPHYMALCVCIS